MKKFFSLLCATLLVFSASAAPVAKKAELVKKAPVAVEQMQSVQFEKAQTLNINQLSATPALTVSNQKAEAPAILGKKVVKANLQQPSAQPAVHKAPAAVQEVIEVTDGELYQESGYIQIWSETQQLYFIYYLNDGDFELNTTYSLTDMYMACAMTEDYDQDNATACSITITKPEGLLNIVASMTTESGKEYAITYAETPFVPTGVQINVNATNYKAEYISYYGEYVYTASNTDFDIALWVYTDTELGTFTDDVDIEGSYLQVAGGGAYVTFHSVVTPIVVAQDEDGNKSLTGSLYADNGDEYVFNLTYEKPDAKEITLVADTLDFFTKMLSAGYYQMQGYTVDSTYAFSFYFISKSLSGNYTEEDMDAYSTWVDQKDGKKTVVSYQNLSAANIKASLVNDTLYYTGTMTLATNDGQEANITLNLSCPYTQEWGEWADFAPFDFNTGKYTFSAAASGTQTNIPVQVRKDNTGLKQFKFAGWGKQVISADGIDLLVDMASDYTCTVAEQNTGKYNSNYQEYVMVSDLATYSGQDFPSTYDPETGTFELAMIYYISLGNFGYGYETMVMDKLITERDTVDIVSTKLNYNDLIASNKVVIYYALDVEGYYLFRVTSNNATSVDGTFKWSDGTINDPNSYFSVSGTDKNYFQDGEFTVVTNNKDIALTGWMIGTDEKFYRLNMSYTAPTTRDTVYFNGKGVTISECTDSQSGVQTGWLYGVTDASTGYRFTLQSTVVANKYGTFSYEDKTLGSNYYNVYDPQGNRQQFVEGSITVGEVGDSLILDGELIAEDEKVYILHFAQSASVLNYDTDAPFDATFEYADMSTDLDEGVIGIYATNAEGLTIGLELYADPAATKIPEGVYTISDSQEAGTALQSLGVAGGYLTECWAGVRTSSGISDCWFMVEGTITLSYDEYGKLKVEVDAKNSYGQPVTALVQYVKLEPKSTVDIANADLFIYEGYVEKYGIMNFYGENADGYEFDLYAYADTIAGDFLEAIDFGDCELTLADDSHVGVIDAYEFKVELDGKNLTLTAKVLGTDTVQYNITATGYLGYIGGDAKETYVGEFSIKNVTLIQASKTLVMLNALNADGDTLALAFDAKFSKTEGDIVKAKAGEYDAITASTGWTAFGQITPSFVANDTAAWFIQSGKLTVAEDGSMVFEGVNSYDANVFLSITVPEYYLVGFINGSTYGIEDDIDNLGDYKFVDGKVTVTFTMTSYVQVKDNDKVIFGTEEYVVPAEEGSAIVLATGTEKIGVNAGEYEFTLNIADDDTKTLSYVAKTTGLNNVKANVKAAKRMINGQIVIVRENKEYNILGTAL